MSLESLVLPLTVLKFRKFRNILLEGDRFTKAKGKNLNPLNSGTENVPDAKQVACEAPPLNTSSKTVINTMRTNVRIDYFCSL